MLRNRAMCPKTSLVILHFTREGEAHYCRMFVSVCAFSFDFDLINACAFFPGNNCVCQIDIEQKKKEGAQAVQAEAVDRALSASEH